MTDPHSTGTPGETTPNSPPSFPPQAAPPPPPTSLTAPPGAVGYNNASAYGTGQLARVANLGKAAMWLVAIAVVLVCIRAIVENNLRPDARAFLDGDASTAQFLDSLVTYNLVSVVASLVQIAGGIVSIVWLYRVAKNNVSLQRAGTWGPGWAIGGWFAPPVFFVIPMLTLDQQWKADSPGTTTTNWRQAPGSPLIWAWGVAFSLSSLLPIVNVFNSGVLDATGSPNENLADSLANPGAIPFIVTVLSIIAGVLFTTIIQKLTARHTQMTGEAAA